MKFKIFAVFSIAVVLFACSSQVKVAYEFPDAMTEPVKAEYAKIWEKGKILYDINCAQCHNIKKGNKEYIPDFELEELKGYELRVSNGQHEENMPEERVTPEELGVISTFLLYKKKSGISRRKKPI